MTRLPNHPAAGKAGIALQFAIGHPCPGLPEPHRWPMPRINSFTSLIALLVICAGCQTQRGKLRAVDLSDGVSQSEAMVIGQCYSDKHLGGGKITSIEDGGDHWVVVAKPVSFDIDKHSGKITSQVGPSYDRPLDIYR
jgi:hypothetical protein